MTINKPLFYAVLGLFAVTYVSSETAFEKITELDFRGTTYYTIRNLTLWDCRGWCREEPECAAASFSFVWNPLAPVQETLCLLQNETRAKDPSAPASRAPSTYYMVKLSIRSENVCDRSWTFERVVNKTLRGLDNVHIYTSNKEDCLAACLNERVFVCRSVEYNYVTLQCHLSEHDRRSVGVAAVLEDANGIDYFENLCLSASQACRAERTFGAPQIGVAPDKIAQYASLHYYVDKELMANTAAGCKRACSIEKDFLCRSFLYKGPPSESAYNCQLFHLDHFTLPDGAATYLSKDRPLLEYQSRVGTYYENICTGYTGGGGAGGSLDSEDKETGGGTIVLPGGSNAGGYGSGSDGFFGGGTYGIGTTVPPSSISENCDRTGICYDVSVHCKDTKIAIVLQTNKKFNGRIYALGRSETCNVDVMESTRFQFDLTMEGKDCNTQKVGGVFTNTIVVQRHSVVMTKTDKIYKVRCTYDMTSKNITFGMLPIRDPEMIPITSAPEAPSPRIRILDVNLREVETVRIGDKLNFRIEIPEETPYGIFARSCVAMAKDSRSTFQIIDDDGCPVEPTIFPHFTKQGSALQALYEAFRFTESYGVIFQCNVKYCLGSCKPAQCHSDSGYLQSYGRRKRDLSSFTKRGHAQKTIKGQDTKESEEEMSISQEILVLDLGDEQSPQYKRMSKQTIEDNFFNATSYQAITPDVSLFETCPTRSSVLALAVTCAVLLLIYVLTVSYFAMKKWAQPPKRIH